MANGDTANKGEGMALPSACGMERVFTSIYKQRAWGDRGGGSGPGSDAAFCAPLADFLTAHLRERGARSLVDLGCGAMTWMPAVVAGAGVDYTGVDCVKSVVDAAAARLPHLRFVHADFMGADVAALPRGDVVFVKDVLQHHTSEAVDAWLRAFFAARPDAHLLVANCAYQRGARVLAPGGFVPLDGGQLPLAAFAPREVFAWETKRVYALSPPPPT